MVLVRFFQRLGLQSWNQRRRSRRSATAYKAMKNRNAFVVLCVIALILAGCTTTKVKRLSENTKMDLSGRWNDTDIQLISNSMIQDCLKGSWIKAKTKSGGKPVVIIGVVENRSSEHIDTTIISKKLEAALVNSGKVLTVNDFENRDLLVSEREYQEENATKKTAKVSGKETGADYMLLGSVKTNLDQEGKKSVRTYYVSLELVNIETGVKVWMNEDSIKKYIERDAYRF
ncbi:MAG: penicillin-binding protein activator LpoB [Sphaerochaetaceae bacterium]|jgi:uncharacterized protein (TIGR02722 family)